MRTPAQERAVAEFLAAHRGLFADLLRPYTRRLSAEDAEELAAEAMAEAAKGFEQWRVDHPSGALPETLAARFVTGMLANHRRTQALPGAKARREEGSLSEIVHTYDDGAVITLSDTLEAPDEWAPLDARLMLDDVATSPALSPRQREALALRREGVGLRKTAAALGISESGARDLIARTERSARRALGVPALK